MTTRETVSEKIIDTIYKMIRYAFVRRKWVNSSSINSHLPIRQIYVWLIDNKERVLIVSKDGTRWQMPGGKPEAGEDIYETGIREILEETTLDIHKHRNGLKLYGYYEVKEGKVSKEGNYEIQNYIQGRMILGLNNINISEVVNKGIENEIQYVKLVNLRELGKYLPRLISRDEFHYAKKIISNNK